MALLKSGLFTLLELTAILMFIGTLAVLAGVETGLI
jgi:hypothetical protein